MRETTILDTVSSEGLSERSTIRNYDFSVFEAIYHVVEDFSMHAGQIMLITRLLTGKTTVRASPSWNWDASSSKSSRVLRFSVRSC